MTLADGSTQEVLMPQVYIHASNVQNLGGRISGSDVTVAAAQDINNLGGAIDGSNSVTLAAGRDINVNSTSVSTANAVTSGTNINQVASVSGKDITLAAGRDVTANAAVVAGTGDVNLAAGRNVSLGTVNENFRQQISWANDSGASNWVGTLTGPNLVDQSNGAHGISESGVNRATLTGSKEVSTQVSGNNISIRAGQDVVTRGTQIVAEGALSATAGRDVRIETANESGSARDEHQHSSGGLLTATSVKTDDSSSYSRNVGSTFSGNTVAVRAGNDVNITGSDVVSTQGTALAAGNNVNIVAATDSSTQRNFRQETKSGVMGAGFGVTVGSRVQSQDVDGQSKTAAASTVGSVEGNVSIVAGNRYTQVGSDVVAPKGDIDIAAKSVEIKAAEQASRTVTEDKYKQSGVTLSVTSPVISAMQSVDQMSDAASKTKSGRAKALAAATAGMSVYSAVGDMQKASAEGSGNIGISVMLGSSQNSSRTEQNTVTQRGSTVASGGNMSIRATGGGTDSNITIAGSDINAKGNLALKADNDINLIASQNTDEQHGDRSSSSWGVGFTAQFGSQTKFGFTANAAGSRGNSDGKDVSNVMTQVRAGGQVNIDSRRDTNLIGATVSGDKVVADVGRDLNIASVQDTSTFKSRDQSIGGSATIGYGSGASVNASRSRVDADYASVGQQAGIMAGDGGFQINVKGNTDLKGAQIASTDKAVEEGKNSLTTGTLTSSDIQNRSRYSAESQSVSAGTSGGKPGGGAGIGNASGSETSVTRSGVSGGAVKITDAQAQQAKTGQSPDQVVASLDTSVRTGKDSSNSLAKNWNGNELREDVEAQAKITQAFGQQAAKMVGTYADQKEKELRLAASKAAQDGDQAQSDELSAEAEKWKEGGAYRAGAHSAIGLLAGGVSGALGAAASSALMPDIAEQIKKLGLPPVVESAVALAAAAGVGAAVGGGAGAASAYNVDLNNRQLHMVTYLRLREGCRGSSSAECQTINRMMGVRSGMPVDDPLIPASKVVTNYDSNNSIVSYILIDNNSGRPKMIMEPLEYAAYRNSPVGIQALMELSPQYSLDFASAGIYAAAGDNGRAREHLLAGVTSRDYARDVALSIVGGVASRLGGAVTEAESAAEIAAGLKSRSGNIEASANSARNQYYGDGNGAAPSPVGNASGSSGGNIKWPSGSGTNSASAIDEGAALSASGKLSNLYPGDPAMPGPRYKLMQTVSGDFKYQMPNGDLRTPKGTFDFVQVNGEIRIAPPKNDPDVSGHLSLSKGADVDYAGTIQFSQSGKIKFWDNDSGHYQPPAKGAAVVKLPPNLFKPIGD